LSIISKIVEYCTKHIHITFDSYCSVRAKFANSKKIFTHPCSGCKCKVGLIRSTAAILLFLMLLPEMWIFYENRSF